MPDGRIAAQRHDVADAGVPVGAGDVVDLALRGGDAGQVGGGVDAGFLLEARHGLVGALAGRAAGAVGHREEGRAQRRETLDGLPQGALGRLGLGRRELEGDLQPLRCARGEIGRAHLAAPWISVVVGAGAGRLRARRARCRSSGGGRGSGSAPAD